MQIQRFTVIIDLHPQPSTPANDLFVSPSDVPVAVPIQPPIPANDHARRPRD